MLAKPHADVSLLTRLMPSAIDKSSGFSTVNPLYYDIRRDLELLLNTKAPFECPVHTKNISSLYYGMFDFMLIDYNHEAGRLELCQRIQHIIGHFEPRLQHISVYPWGEATLKHNLSIRIEAELNVSPPQSVSFESMIDPQSQSFTILRG